MAKPNNDYEGRSNDVCGVCHEAYVFKHPWWAYGGSKTSTDLSWGYLVHCAQGHFHWYRAKLTSVERAVGEARFNALHPPACDPVLERAGR